MKYLNYKGATIAYEQMGSGSPALFLHCSSGSHRQWLFAARQFADRHLCLLPDLMGYGETSSQFDDDGNATDCVDTDVIGAMVDIAGAPVDIFAHSYGAATAIEYALTHPGHVKSLFLVEPVSFHFLKCDRDRTHWQAVDKLARRVIAADRRGRPALAAWHYMTFWLGKLRWLAAPGRVKRRVISTIGKVAYECSLVYALSTSLPALRELDIDVTLVEGDRTRPAARAVTRILSDTLPRVRKKVIDGAGHMSPFTHQNHVLAHVRNHLLGLPR